MEALKLDAKDYAILAELDENSRRSYSEIGKKVRLSKNSVAYRIKALEESGVIKGYYTLVDASRLGFFGLRLYIKLQNASPEEEKSIMKFLVAHPSTWWVAYGRGKWDMVAIFWVKSNAEFVKFWDAFAEKFADKIKDKLFCAYHQLHHYKLPFTKKLKGEKAGFEVVGGNEAVKTDGGDIKLLEILSENARMPLIEIADKMGMTPAAISYRIKRLTDSKVIVGFRTAFDTELLGYTHFKADFYLKNYSAMRKMVEYCRHHPNIFYYNKSVGGPDFEIEFYATSPREFFDFIAEMRTKFKENISSYDFYNLMPTKIKYFSR